MKAGACRAIDYEVVALEEAICQALIAGDVSVWANTRQVAIVRCVDHQGQKLTALTDAGYFSLLLASGKAGDPNGMPLGEREFPIVHLGWQPGGWLPARAPGFPQDRCAEEATDVTAGLCGGDQAPRNSMVSVPSDGDSGDEVLVETRTWRALAACRGKPQEWWFPDHARRGQVDYSQALAVCAICPVKVPCAAVSMAERDGMWGGLTPSERDERRKNPAA